MKKIIKLKESDLNRIIKQVIEEQLYAKKFDDSVYNSENPAFNLSPGFQNMGSTSVGQSEPAPYKPNVDLKTLNLKRGSKGPEVSKYQLALLNLGLSIGGSKTADGIFGPTTEHSVKWFQNKYGLPVTGVIDQATGDLLLQKMNAKGTANKFLDKLGDSTKLPPPPYVKPRELDKSLPPEWQRDNRETWVDPNAGKKTQPKVAQNSNKMGGGGWLTKKLANKG